MIEGKRVKLLNNIFNESGEIIINKGNIGFVISTLSNQKFIIDFGGSKIECGEGNIELLD